MANPNAKYLNSPFPQENVDPKTKRTDDYGKKVAKAIYGKYVTRQQNGYYKRIRTNRLYSQGKQNTLQYRKQLDPSIETPGNKSWLNISWENSPVLPKFVSVIYGDMINQEFRAQFNSVDPTSQTRKDEARDKFYGKLVRKEFAQAMEAETGIKVESFSEKDPASEEEIDLHMDLEYKEDVEIAMEEIVNWEYDKNNFNEIRKPICRDLIENNKGGFRLNFDENNHITFKYLDLEYLIHPYTEDPMHKDCEYYGYVDTMTIRDVRRLSKFSEDKLFMIAKNSCGRNNNPKEWKYGDGYSTTGYYNQTEYAYDDFTVEVLDFVFYTADEFNYRYKENKHGGHFLNRKGYGYRGPKNKDAKSEGISKKVEMEYCGYFIPATGDIFKYGVSDSIVRRRSADKPSPDCLRKFVIYEIGLRGSDNSSFVEKIIPNEDQIQLHVRKIRQFVAEAMPRGIAVDIDSLVEAAKALEDVESPMELIHLFKSKGIIVYDRTDENGEYKNGAPVEDLPNGIGDSLLPFYNGIQAEIAMMRDVTGVNEARDASSPDSKALVGIQKLQLINSNNVTREIYKGFTDGVFYPSASVLASMVQDKAYIRGGLKEYENVIGKLGIKSLETLEKDVALTDLGVVVEILPGEAELEVLNQDIAYELQAGTIATEDAQEIRRIKNPKKAERLLRLRKKKKQEADMEAKRQQEEMAAQREQQAIMASAEAEKVKNESKMQMSLAEINAKKEAEIEVMKFKYAQEAAIENIKGRNELDKIRLAGEMRLDESSGSNLVPDEKTFPAPVEATKD